MKTWLQSLKWLPDRNVLAGGIGGVITWLIILGLQQAGITDIPSDVQNAITGLIIVLIAHYVPPSDHDIVKRLNDAIVKMAQLDPKVPVTNPRDIVPKKDVN